MEVIIVKSAAEAARKAARIYKRMLDEKPTAVLGLATGSTPLKLYSELVRMCENGEIDFSRATTFNLDEYVGLPEGDPNSYRYFMDANLFDKINIDKKRTHMPCGNADDVNEHCAEYDAKIRLAGGIDLQLLGIGADGHIGFNEPTSSLTSRTRIKTLTKQTISDNARFFGGDPDKVPTHAITMGIGSIMDARMIVLLAFGENKAEAIKAAIEGPISAMVPASALQMHKNVKVIMDEPAASQLRLREYYDWVYERKPEWQKDA